MSKPDTSAPVEILIRVMGGNAGATSSLAPRLGPLGVPPKKASDEILKATNDWKGIRLMVKLIIVNRQVTVEVCPTASAYIIKELGTVRVKGGTKHTGDLSIEQVKKIARLMRPRSLAKTFQGTFLETLGTCLAVGCTVNGESPKALKDKIKKEEVVITDD